MKTNKEKLDEIHIYMINGQFQAMTDCINEYGLYDFFDHYEIYLSIHSQYTSKVLNEYSKCVCGYMHTQYR